MKRCWMQTVLFWARQSIRATYRQICRLFLERAAVVGDMNQKGKTMRHKVGASVAAARRGGALQAVDTMNHFFLNHEMYVVGSTYWNMAFLLSASHQSAGAEGASLPADIPPHSR